MTYSGVRCPVCNKKFGNSDDIVVCPVCGAPHHRECYFAGGQCVFAAEHMSGKAWQPEENTGGDSAAGGPVCADCNTKNPPDNLFCSRCGNRLDGERHHGAVPFAFGGAYKPYDTYAAADDKEPVGELTAQEYAQYIGRSRGYYLPVFKRLGQGIGTVSLNIPAFLFGFLFFFYRKMYLVGGVLLAAFIVCMTPAVLTMRDVLSVMEGAGPGVSVYVEDLMESGYYGMMRAAWGINFLIAVITSLAANRIYYIQATRAISRMRREYDVTGAVVNISDCHGYREALGRAGGCSVAIVIALIVGLHTLLNFALIS